VRRGDAFVDCGLGDLVAGYGVGVGEGVPFDVEGRACAFTRLFELFGFWIMGKGGLTACVAGLKHV
jgi:hypothetical protein